VVTEFGEGKNCSINYRAKLPDGVTMCYVLFYDITSTFLNCVTIICSLALQYPRMVMETSKPRLKSGEWKGQG